MPIKTTKNGNNKQKFDTIINKISKKLIIFYLLLMKHIVFRQESILFKEIGERKMSCKKSKFLAISLVLMMTLAMLLAATNFANAAPIVQTVTPYAHIMPIPTPIGVGQTLLVTFRLDKVTPTATSPSAGDRWQNFQINIIRPDGLNETRGPFSGDATGGSWFSYTPTQVGNYTFQMFFPGQWVNYTSGTGANAVTYNNYYTPSMSNPAEGRVTVQNDPIQSIPNNPLPTSYWTRPIYGENKNWNTIADNWLMVGYDYSARTFTISSTFAPYTSAPDSGHILWTTPVILGGIVGGNLGDRTYYTGLSYEQFYSPLIIQGQIIYVDHGPSTTRAYGTRALDLYTGEQLWYLNDTAITFAQILQVDTPNEHGALPFLWSVSGSGTNQTWTMYDAFSANTGQAPRQYLTVTNITSGSAARRGPVIQGPNGELLTYYFDNNRHWLSMWNSTLAILGPPPNDYWSPTYGSVINGARGIQWNVTIPNFNGPMGISQVNGGYIFCSNLTGIAGSPFPYIQLAFPATLNKLSNGSYPTTLEPLWTKTRSIYMAAYKFSNILDNTYVMFDEGTLKYYAYDIRTGNQIWETDPVSTGWGVFTYNHFIAYGKLYSAGFDGHLRAYNIANGNLVWDYYFGSAGYETPYGVYPNYAGFNIADGKIYITNDEHSPDSVIWRGGKLWCINAETGQEVWNVSGWMRQGAIADGYLTAINSLNGMATTIGKGPSKTTVEAPQTAVQAGTQVLITGKVTDQSPGAMDTPAIADKDMGAWMEYLYMQKPMPTNAAGVEVVLSAKDTAGNSYQIGTTTTDIGGAYGIEWTPPTPGKYSITATFGGTNSYGTSYATTYLIASAAPSPTSTTQPTSPNPTIIPTEAPTTSAPTTASPSAVVEPASGISTETLLIAAAAAVIVIAITAAAIVLRKHK